MFDSITQVAYNQEYSRVDMEPNSVGLEGGAMVADIVGHFVHQGRLPIE